MNYKQTLRWFIKHSTLIHCLHFTSENLLVFSLSNWWLVFHLLVFHLLLLPHLGNILMLVVSGTLSWLSFLFLKFTLWCLIKSYNFRFYLYANNSPICISSSDISPGPLQLHMDIYKISQNTIKVSFYNLLDFFLFVFLYSSFFAFI